jgi:hypothetical protein
MGISQQFAFRLAEKSAGILYRYSLRDASSLRRSGWAELRIQRIRPTIEEEQVSVFRRPCPPCPAGDYALGLQFSMARGMPNSLEREVAASN